MQLDEGIMIVQLRAHLLIWRLKIIVRTLFIHYSKFFVCVDPLDCEKDSSFDCSFAGKLLDKFLKDHDAELTRHGYNISTLCLHMFFSPQ